MPSSRSGPPSSRKGLPATLLIAVCVVDGFLAGGLLGGRVFASGPGWDALGSALGGASLGVVVAIALSVVLVRSFDARALTRWLAAALLLLLALFGAIQVLKRGGEEEPPPRDSREVTSEPR